MGWYFMPGEMAEKTRPMLKVLGVITVDAVVTTPEPAAGVSIYVENGDLRPLLDHLGFADTEFDAVPSNLEGVEVLVRRGRRALPAALRPARAERPREGAAAFAEAYLAAATQARAEVEAAEKTVAGEIERFTRELAAASAQAESLALQRAALEAVDQAVTAALEVEFETIKGDPRVASVATVGDLIVIETGEITIETRARRTKIGRLRLTIGAFDGSVKIEALQALGPTAHPIVSTTGVPYLGALRDALVRYIGRRDFAAAAKLILDFLGSPPRDGGVEELLARWPEAPPAPAPPAPATPATPAA